MKQIRMKNAEGKTYVFPAYSDEEVDAVDLLQRFLDLAQYVKGVTS